jgi:hypothetical protein
MKEHDMNKRSFRRVAVFASVATLAGGAVAGCGSAASSTGSGAGTSQQQTGQPPQGDGMDVTALAGALGVTTAKLQAALQKSMPQPGQQGSTPPSGSPDDMAATLAKELGLSESKVQAALEKLMPQGGPPAGGNGQAAPSVTPEATTTS